jgi:hypothetical protein
MKLQVGDLFVTNISGQPSHTGIIVKFNDKLVYSYYIEWSNSSSSHYQESQIIDLIKGKSVTYFPIVK